MRALPPLTLILTNHRNWNAAVRGIATVACGALVAWMVGGVPAPSVAHLLGLGVAVAAIVFLASSACLNGSLVLRWNGEGWQLGDPPRAAECRLAVDLGAWMLLRCRTEDSVTWLPLQRSDLRADWHALRCAIHAPRPGAVRAGQGEPESPTA